MHTKLQIYELGDILATKNQNILDFEVFGSFSWVSKYFWIPHIKKSSVFAGSLLFNFFHKYEMLKSTKGIMLEQPFL